MILLVIPREEKLIYRYTKYQIPDHISIKWYLVYTLFLIIAIYTHIKIMIINDFSVYIIIY